MNVLSDPSREQIVAALNMLFADLNEGDSAMVYFSGHGIATAHDGYWITADALKARSNDSGFEVDAHSVIANRDIVKWMKRFQTKTRQVVVMSDSTFRDGLERDVTLTRSDVQSVLARQSALAWTSMRNEPVASRKSSLFVEGLLESLKAVDQFGQGWAVGADIAPKLNEKYRKDGMPMNPRYSPVSDVDVEEPPTFVPKKQLDALVDYVFERRAGAAPQSCKPSKMPVLKPGS